ncbi:MAG: mandelate racemase/muconate lactonizing enzyme family protein [Bryobacteraceae bacterium]|nr:mandelate racemase/muconate lactonizing enzyme family protein [Bryobacteraceae bacterium]
MQIKSVRSFLLSYPFREPVKLSYYGGDRTILKRDAMLIRVEASNGLVGYGPGQGSEKAHQAIQAVIAPFLEGRALVDPDALRVHFTTETNGDPELVKLYCGVELALYDLLGKERELPVSELVGGRVRDSIRLYGSAGMYQPPERYAAEAAGIANLGFPAYKMRPALGPEQDVETVRLMREAVGPGVELMVDAHTWWRMGDRSYDAATIEQVAERMSAYNIAWLEEPLPPDDHEAYLRFREKNIVPLASGEHEPSEERYRDLILTRAVDYVQMDVVCQGGYPVGRRVLADVAREGLRFAFHSWGTDLEVIAAAHLGICWPEAVVEWLEYPLYSTDKLETMYPFPLATEILIEPLRIRQGELKVSTAPGLGVSVDESVIERYPWIPGTWSIFSLISPPGTWSVTSDHSVRWAEQDPAS